MSSLKRAPLNSTATNLSSKVYVRTTRNGKVQKIVREVYLRQDIPCSSKLCAPCQRNLPKSAGKKAMTAVLSERPASSKSIPRGHYLIPDTNAFLNAMDLFELQDEFKDVIVLQTVLEEVKNRSLPIYYRLVELIKDADKRFCTFFNDFRYETYISRNEGESINDRNDRAIRRAADWYQKHLTDTVALKAQVPFIVIITNDRDNKSKALQDGLRAHTMSEYISGLEHSAQLLDMLNESEDMSEIRKTNQKEIYPDHYSVSKMLTGIKAGTLHQGPFNISTYNHLERLVKTPAFEKPLLVLGRENSSRAISGDIVCVELLPQSQWKAPSTKILDEENLTQNDNPDTGEGENVISERERKTLREQVKAAHGNSKNESQHQPTARVVGIIRRNWRQYVGHIDTTSVHSTGKQNQVLQSVFLKPMDRKIPKIRMRTRQAADLVGKRVLVNMDSWDRNSRYPSGHFVRSLGNLESKEAETEALLLEYDVQYRPFPRAVLDCLPEEGHAWKADTDTRGEFTKVRRDLRDLEVCSIDPISCTDIDPIGRLDIDDALHAFRMPNGNVSVGVHIADVSHFVKPDTAMENEASMRATTFYLVDKRIDMLPPLLGTDLCSLRPGVDRFTFSVIWQMTPDANVVKTDVFKSIIRSRAGFSYEEAQARIDDPSQKDTLTQSMRLLLDLSRKLKAKRMVAGALSLSSPEVRIELESETSDQIEVKTKKLLATNSLVEEFMLLANCSVADYIYKALPSNALLRRHATPPSANFAELADQLRVKRNMTLRYDSSKALADSLDTCIDPQNPFFNTLVRIVATRCMTSAEYFRSGTQPDAEFRHYGLAAPIYTHFTSPIRRYADLVVHRQLARAMSSSAQNTTGDQVMIEAASQDLRLVSNSWLDDICDNLNVRHRNAQMAGRASVTWYAGQALRGRVVEEKAWVIKVFENGIGVFIPKYGLEGLVRLRDMGWENKRADFNSTEYSLTLVDEADKNKLGKIVAKVDLFSVITVKIRDEVNDRTGVRGVKMELVI